MAIAARLNDDLRGWRRRTEIVRHHTRETAQEGKGRLFHSVVPKGNEVREPSNAGLLEERDWVRAIGVRGPRGVRRSRHRFAQRLASRSKRFYRASLTGHDRAVAPSCTV